MFKSLTSFFTLCTKSNYAQCLSPRWQSTHDKLRGDWQNIGKDMISVFNKINKEMESHNNVQRK